MRLTRVIVACLVALLMGCAEPLPAEKTDYVGEWRAENMRLHIAKNGHVEYQRRTQNGNVSINASLLRFEGDNFVVGIGMFNTTFVVARPPHRDGAVWRMTVDGVDLVRQDPGAIQT